MTTMMNTHAPAKSRSAEQELQQSVQRRLKECSYAFIFCKVTTHFEGGRLTLRGSVPSFYLKQMLQELLRDIDYVKQLHNEVDVVSANGVSSVRPSNSR
ncbi:MAG: BON domain-containing protein [Candidatus Paceibacterota bacterium]